MPVYQDRLPRFAADGGISWSWWRKLSKRERTIAAAAFATIPLFVFLFVFSPISISRKFTKTNSNTNAGLASEWVPFTALSKAKENSAFCLDGSVPGYHLRRGFGSGSDSWILHAENFQIAIPFFINMYYSGKFTISYTVAFENYVNCRSRAALQNHSWTPAGSSIVNFLGGGWCSTVSSCSARKRTKLGSSTYMEQQVQLFGILSHDPLQNPVFKWVPYLQCFTLPEKCSDGNLIFTCSVIYRSLAHSDFFNWNKVKIRYCDGSSFSSHPDNEFRFKIHFHSPKLQNGTKMLFRGQLIWETLMDELLSIGMSKAREALLTGCSAGGLATLIHCDDFRYLLPKDANVKCLADAGFFLNEKDIAGNHTIESFFRDVVHLQGVAKSLNHDCVAKSEPSKCFFPQEFIRNIKTPLFLVQSAYDFWQIANILG
ncbi:hypothetical protein OROGR_029475 [Orobanche gracilis]